MVETLEVNHDLAHVSAPLLYYFYIHQSDLQVFSAAEIYSTIILIFN